jgi:uncharacterized membrane protein YphA (DoxX/SURF4 family)
MARLAAATNIVTPASAPALARWLVFACRVVVGCIFVLAAVTKLTNPGSFAATLLAYSVLPVAAVRPLALTLPWVELLVGGYLLVGLFTRAAAWGAIALLVVFSAAIAQALARGLSLDHCGCFGDIAAAVPALSLVLGGESAGAGDLLRDAIFALLALAVAIGPATPASIDGWREQRRTSPIEAIH